MRLGHLHVSSAWTTGALNVFRHRCFNLPKIFLQLPLWSPESTYCPKHLSQRMRQQFSYSSPHKSLQHLLTSELGTYLSDSGIHLDHFANTIYFSLRTFFILRREWKQLNVPENWSHEISTYPVTAIITQNGNSKCFREQTTPVQGKWVQRLYHCFSARRMNKFAPWVEATGTKFLSLA